MSLVTGVDLVDIPRFTEVLNKFGDRFTNRIFTPYEIEDVKQNVASLAARFAAKEATAKALGTGIGQVGWKEIEILRSETRQPLLYLHGNAAHKAEQLGIHIWSISLTHTTTHAIALVVGMGK